MTEKDVLCLVIMKKIDLCQRTPWKQMILRKDFENLSKTFAKFSNELICELLGIKGTAKRLFNALTKLSKELANELFGTKGTSME